MNRRMAGRRPALLLLLILSGIPLGARTPSIRLLPATPGEGPPEESSPTCSDPWEALQHLALPRTETGPGDPVRRGLAEGLAALLEGQAGKAEQAFRQLVPYSGEPRLEAAAADLLGETLWSQGRWAEFIEGGSRYSQGLRDDLPLAEVFRQADPEIWEFPAGRVELKLAASPLGPPVLPVLVNGRRFDFWLDTGAGLTVLAEDTARQAAVLPGGRETPATTATRRQVPVRGAIIEELRIGAATVRRLPAVVVSREDLTLPAGSGGRPVRIAGLIGWQALRRLRLGLDPRHRRVWLEKPAEDSTIRPGGSRNLFWIGYPVLKTVSAGGVPLYFGLDSGAVHSSLTETGLSRSGVARGKDRRRRIASAGGTETAVTPTAQRLDLWLAKRRLQLEGVPVWPARGATFVQLDGIFGSDLLRQAPVIIDGGNGRFEWGQ